MVQMATKLMKMAFCQERVTRERTFLKHQVKSEKSMAAIFRIHCVYLSDSISTKKISESSIATLIDPFCELSSFLVISIAAAF